MKLNHDIYEATMANVRLSEEDGMRLLEEAAHRNMQRGQRWKMRAAAIALVILTLGISLNGICYAQTGKNALEMFLTMFQDGDMNGMEALAAEAKESGESITDENLRFTLEYYWYDRENVEGFYAIRIDSLDGTPLDIEAVRKSYFVLPEAYFASALDAGSKMSEDGTSSLECYYTQNAYDEFGKSADSAKINLWKYQESIGCFQLEPTGQAKARYADFSALGLGKARITGAGLKLSMNCIWDKSYKPFQVLDVVMKDGTIYRSDDTEHLSYTEAEQVQQEIKNIHNCAHGYFASNEKANAWTVYTLAFADYINVDDIAAVYVDGVELPIK